MNDEVQFVICPECGNEQADMGRNLCCEECGYSPMPSAEDRDAESESERGG